MDIENLSRYYPTFYRISGGDGTIDSDSDKDIDRYYYYDDRLNPERKSDRNNDGKLDFWEYLEAKVPCNVKGIQKNDVLDYSLRMTLERSQKENKDLLFVYAHLRDDRSLFPSLNETSRKTLADLALRNINHWEANARKNSVVVLGDLYLYTDDKDLRTAILDQLIFKASGPEAEVRSQAIKALSGIYGKLGSANKKEKQYILDIIMANANNHAPENTAPFEASIGFLSKNYRIIISEDSVKMQEIIILLLSVIEPPKKDPEVDRGYYSKRETEESLKAKKSQESAAGTAIKALFDIYKSNGIQDKELYDRAIDYIKDWVSQDSENRGIALKFLEYVLVISSDQALKDSIYKHCSFLSEFVADTFHLIKDKAKRAEIVGSLCGSYNRYGRGTDGKTLARIFLKLDSSEKKQRQQIIDLAFSAIPGILLANYMEAKPEDVEKKKKSLSCLIADSNVDDIFALYAGLRSRATKEANELVDLLFEELNEHSKVVYIALHEIYFDTTNEGIKNKIQYKMFLMLSTSQYVNEGLSDFISEMVTNTKTRGTVNGQKALDTLISTAAKRYIKPDGRSNEEMNNDYKAAGNASDILMSVHNVTTDKEQKKKIERALGKAMYMGYLYDYSFPGEFEDREQWMSAVESSIQAKFTIYELQNYKSVESAGGMSGNFQCYMRILAAYYRSSDDEAIKKRILDKYKTIMKEQMERPWRCNVFKEFNQAARFSGDTVYSLNLLTPILDELYSSTKDERIHDCILDAVLNGLGGVDISQEETSERIIKRLFEEDGRKGLGIKAMLINRIIEQNKKDLSYHPSESDPLLGTAHAAILSMCYSNLNNDTDIELKKIILSLFCEHVSKDNTTIKLDILLPVFSGIGSLDSATQEKAIKGMIENVDRGSDEAVKVLIHLFNEAQPAQKQTRMLIIKKLMEYSLLEDAYFHQNLLWAEGFMYASMDAGEREYKEKLLKTIINSGNRSNIDAATEVLKGIFLQLTPEDKGSIEKIITKLCDLQAIEAFKSLFSKALVKVNNADRKALIERSFEISMKKENFIKAQLLTILYVNLKPGDERQMKLKILDCVLSMSDQYDNFEPEAIKAITEIYNCILREGDSYMEDHLIGRIIEMSKSNKSKERDKSINMLDAIYWRFPEKKDLRNKIVDIIFNLSEDSEYIVKGNAKHVINRSLKDGGKEFFFRQAAKYKDAATIPDFFIDQIKNADSMFKMDAARLLVKALNDKRGSLALESIASIIGDYPADESVKSYFANAIYDKYQRAGSGEIKEKIFTLLLESDYFVRLSDIRARERIIDIALADEKSVATVIGAIMSLYSSSDLSDDARKMIASKLWGRMLSTKDVYLKDYLCSTLIKKGIFKKLDSVEKREYILDKSLSIIKMSESPDVLMNVSDNLSAIMGDEDIDKALRLRILETFISFAVGPASCAFYAKKYKDNDYVGLLIRAQLATAICENAISAIKAMHEPGSDNKYLSQILDNAEGYLKNKGRNLQDIAGVIISKIYKMFIYGQDRDKSVIGKDLFDRINKLYARPVGPSGKLYSNGVIRAKIYFQEFMKEAIWVDCYLNSNHGYVVDSMTPMKAQNNFSFEQLRDYLKEQNAGVGNSRVDAVLRDPPRLKKMLLFFNRHSGEMIKMNTLSDEEKSMMLDLFAGRLVSERVFSKTSAKKSKIIDDNGKEREIYLRAEVIVPCSKRKYTDFHENIFNDLAEGSNIDYIVYSGHAGMTAALTSSFKAAKAYFSDVMIQISCCTSQGYLSQIQKTFRYAHPILTKTGAQTRDGCIIFGTTIDNMLENGTETRYENIRAAIKQNEYKIGGEKIREIVPDNYFFISDDYYTQKSDIDGDGNYDINDNDYTFNVVIRFDDYFDVSFRPVSSQATPEDKARSVQMLYEHSFGGDPLLLKMFNIELDQNTEGRDKGWFWPEQDTNEAIRIERSYGENANSYLVKFNIGYANSSVTSLQSMAVYETALKLAEGRGEEATKAKGDLEKNYFNVTDDEAGRKDAEKCERLAKEKLGLSKADIDSAYERLGIAKDAQKQLCLVNTARAFLLGAEVIEKYYLFTAKTLEEKENAKRLYDSFISTYNLPKVDFDTCLQILDLSDNAPIMWYIAYLAKNNVKLPDKLGKRNTVRD